MIEEKMKTQKNSQQQAQDGREDTDTENNNRHMMEVRVKPQKNSQ